VLETRWPTSEQLHLTQNALCLPGGDKKTHSRERTPWGLIGGFGLRTFDMLTDSSEKSAGNPIINDYIMLCPERVRVFPHVVIDLVILIPWKSNHHYL